MNRVVFDGRAPRINVVFATFGLLLTFALSLVGQVPPVNQGGTEWKVEPSLKYDALCFLNIMTGDPFYRKLYATEYARFEHALTPGVRAALGNLKRKLKDKNGNVVSAFLSLHFSASSAETLGEMRNALENIDKIKVDLQKTVYYSKDSWKLFESVNADLKTVLAFLESAHFDIYWREEVRPLALAKSAEMTTFLTKHDVAPVIQRYLGRPIHRQTLTVYALYFAKPHGMKLTGSRFITDISYPAQQALRVAIHEQLHPPYDLAKDAGLKSAINQLRKSDFLMKKIRNHDISFGYNSFESYVEEDCVRAVDQIVGEEFGLREAARTRFKLEDGGMHVLSAVLYALMKQEDYRGEVSFRDLLLRLLHSGRLSNNNLTKIYDSFYNG
jgi:hypothetical protein